MFRRPGDVEFTQHLILRGYFMQRGIKGPNSKAVRCPGTRQCESKKSLSQHSFYSPFKSLSFPLPCSRIMFQELSAIVINWIFFFYIHFILTLHLYLMPYLVSRFLAKYDNIKTSASFNDHFCSLFTDVLYILSTRGQVFSKESQ